MVIRSEVRDPRVGLATITAVESSPELDHARVYITALGDDEEKEQVVSGLQSAAPFIRGLLSRRLHMRRVPELHFQYDRMLDEATRIEQLLREDSKPIGNLAPLRQVALLEINVSATYVDLA